jgi:hypothetical protein
VAVDDWFDPRGAGRSAREATRRGGGGATGDLQDFLRDFEEGEEGTDRRRATTFRPGQRPEEMPTLPRRLATYAHGYSYSQGRYPGGVPRYFDGDEVLPGRLPPHNIAALQRMLVDAGLLEDPRWGYWDPASEEAYQRALSEANSAGVEVQTLLTTYGEANALGTAEPKEPFVAPPLQIKQHNKDDLRSVFRKAVVELLGIGWSQEDVNDAVDSFVAKETEIQANAQRMMIERDRQLYETGQTDINQITEVDIPSPELFIEEETRRRDPAGYQATQLAEDFAPAFFAALESPARGGR